MKRAPHAVAGAVILAAAVAAGILWRAAHRGPNLLLVTLDTTRADHLGCYGDAEARTPALDALARSGVMFSRAFCNVPLTLPSHATIMTGLYPPEHGCRANGAHSLGEGVATLADVFSSHGYRTAAFVAAFVLDPQFGLNRGFRTYDAYRLPADEFGDDGNSMYRYRRGDKVADAALAWLESNAGKPFFCWVHFYDPHRPYYVDESCDLGRRNGAYDCEIAFMDAQLGRLMSFLKTRRLLGSTIVIAVADHGESLGEHGEDEHGLLLYNGVMRVPLILSSPGRLPAGEERGTLVSTVDLFPTVLDLFGWKQPGRASGRSFAAALRGGKAPDAPFYAETDFPFTEYGWSPLRSVTAAGWKYIRAPRGELYDEKRDPGEERNLAGELPVRAEELKARLAVMEKAMRKKEAREVRLDEKSQKALESLGYLGGAKSAAAEAAALRDPKDAVWMRCAFIKAVGEFQKGSAASAQATLRALISASPESYAFRYKLARSLYDEGRFEEARAEFEAMARMLPAEYKTHYNLGKTLVRLGLFDRAVAEFRLALKFDPRQTPGWNNLGLALLKSGSTGEAMEALRQSISMDPEQVDPHNNLGHALLSLGRADEAAAEFRRAVEVQPDFFEGRYNLGLALFASGRYAESAKELREAVRLRPGFAPAHRQLGLALVRGGDAREGLREVAVSERLIKGGAPR